MYNSYYQSSISENQEQYRQMNALQMANSKTAADDDEIDYSFSRMSVRERRKLFQADDEPRSVSLYGTLPRGPVSRSVPRYNGQATNHFIFSPNPSANYYEPQYQPQQQQQTVTYRQTTQQTYQAPPVPARQSWNSAVNSAPPPMNRRYSAYDVRPTTSASVTSTRTVELEPAQRPQSLSNYEFYQPQMYSPVRQSRPLYRSPPTVTQTGDQTVYQQASQQPVVYSSVSPTRVVRRTNYTSLNVPRERESTPLWSPAQPLRVRVYNNDRSASSPAQPTHWTQISPAYPAYPAYQSRPGASTPQVYRVIQSPSRVYPQTFNTSYSSQQQYYQAPPQPHQNHQQQQQQIYVPLTPVHRRTHSSPQFPQKSITIYPNLRDRQLVELPRQVYQSASQPRQPPRSDWTVLQPTKIAATQAQSNQSRPSLFGPPVRQHISQPPPPPPPPHQGRVATLPNRPRPKVVNRRDPPSPDVDIGATEF